MVFDVGGVINLQFRLIFKNNQTIAGQTAQGDGITLYGDGTSCSGANNTIVVAQGLQSHSTGGLVQTSGTSILRSLYIDNNSHNPKARGTLQFVNNVVYNRVVSAYILGDTSGCSDCAMLGNYFIA